MRFFYVKQQKDGSLKIQEYMGRLVNCDIGNDYVTEISDAIDIISEFCSGPKKVKIEVIIDGPEMGCF